MGNNPERGKDPGYRLIDALSENVHAALSAQHELDDIVYALGVVGLDRLAERLHGWGAALVESAKAAQAAHSLSLSHNLAGNQAMAGLLLKATLDGCIVPKGAKP